MVYSQPFCQRDGVLSLTWSGSFVPAWQLAMFQPDGVRLMLCLYISPLGVPIADLGILDLSLSHPS